MKTGKWIPPAEDGSLTHINPKWTTPRLNRRDYTKRAQCQAYFKTADRQCRAFAVEGLRYCKKHKGGDMAKAVLASQTPEAIKARSLKVKAYWARLREAAKTDPDLFKRMGVGRPAPGDPPRPPKEKEARMLFQAEKIITEELQALPAVPDKPFDQLEPHEQLVVITGQSLRVVHDILKLPTTERKRDDAGRYSDVVNLKAATLVKDTAIRALGLRVKVDANAMKRQAQDRVLDVIERLKAEAAKQVTVIEG